MRRGAAPFGNELQDDFDVKLVAGRLVHVFRRSPGTRCDLISDLTPAGPSGGKLLSNHKGTVDSQHEHNSRIITPNPMVKLPPIYKFHSAPPKLSFSTAKKPISADELVLSDTLLMCNSQMIAAQRKCPHTLENIEWSCTQLDNLRNGTISLQELADVLYANGISITMATLKEFIEHSRLTVSDNCQVSYRDFLHKMAAVAAKSNSSVTRGAQHANRKLEFMDGQISLEEEDSRNTETRSKGRQSHTAMSCPVTMTTMLGSHDHIVEDNPVSDISVLLTSLQSCFGGTRWGSRSDVQKLQSAFTKADKRRSGILPAVVVSHVFHDQCVPLRGELMEEAFLACEAAIGMIRWTELMGLIRKALPGQLTLQPLETSDAPEGNWHPAANNMQHVTSTAQQEGVSPHAVDRGNLRRQAEELFKRASQHDKIDEPLQKLCNALYTCDPHRTGFLDTKTAIRMVRNYNVVYRLGLDMTSLELFIMDNCTTNRAHRKSSPSAVINISEIVDYLLHELGNESNYIT